MWYTVRKYGRNGYLASEYSHRCPLVALMAATGWALLDTTHDATVRQRHAIIWGTFNGMPGGEQIEEQHGSQKAQGIRPVRQPHEEAGEGAS